MKYALNIYSRAFFEARKVLRNPDNPELANAIMDYATKGSQAKQEATRDSPPKTQHYVVDRVSLLR